MREQFDIGGDGPYTIKNERPDIIDPVIGSTRNLVFFRVSGHFRFRCQGKQRLGCEDVLQTLRQEFFRR